jgi:5-methylthioribose kinase
LVNSLESIIEGFSNQIGPFAVDLGKYLCKLFMKMFHKDAELCANDDYDGEA